MRLNIIGLTVFWLSSTALQAAVYCVSPSGEDANVGSQAQPWRSVNKAAEALQAGDIAIVLAGDYDERVTTLRGGNDENTRLTFRAEGTVRMRGFSINHPYVSVENFTVTRHSSPNRQTGYIEVFANGDHVQLINNQVRDGISLVRNDIIFSDNSPSQDTITTSSGGFIDAGFRPGMSVYFLKAALAPALVNSGSRTIADVTDTVLTLNAGQDIIDEGPTLAYLDASFNYGLVVNPGAENCVIRSNLFFNLDYDSGYLGGESNLYEFNVFENCNGWEAMHFFGYDNVFRRNWIRNSPLKGYSNLSADVFETFGANYGARILFKENWVQNFDGVLGVLRDPSYANLSDVWFLHNVFVDVGYFSVRVPRTVFSGNTFLRVSEHSTEGFGGGDHALNFTTPAGTVGANGALVENNVFIGCGTQDKNSYVHGWYVLDAVSEFFARNNFVAGAFPDYESKVGFPEGNPLLNGGDPGFVDISNPLGLDGVPFTADDGLRLRSDSKLKGKAVGGVDLGAYGSESPPTLLIGRAANSLLGVGWGAFQSGYVLQRSDFAEGPWTDMANTPVYQSGFWVVIADATNSQTFYRLRR